jgi:hypothetical protein
VLACCDVTAVRETKTAEKIVVRSSEKTRQLVILKFFQRLVGVDGGPWSSEPLSRADT